jgi:hypothetical protein
MIGSMNRLYVLFAAVVAVSLCYLSGRSVKALPPDCTSCTCVAANAFATFPNLNDTSRGLRKLNQDDTTSAVSTAKAAKSQTCAQGTVGLPGINYRLYNYRNCNQGCNGANQNDLIEVTFNDLGVYLNTFEAQRSCQGE